MLLVNSSAYKNSSIKLDFCYKKLNQNKSESKLKKRPYRKGVKDGIKCKKRFYRKGIKDDKNKFIEIFFI